MTRGIAWLCLTALLNGCSGTSISLSSAGRVVVPGGQLPPTLGLLNWSPTEEDLRMCEHAIAHRLASTRHDLGRYYLRLGGVLRDGHRHIIGIAEDKQVGTDYARPPSEETIVLPAFGGGEAFFSFDYDMDQKKLSKLEFNAAL
jgi:hypothetical protein